MRRLILETYYASAKGDLIDQRCISGRIILAVITLRFSRHVIPDTSMNLAASKCSSAVPRQDY
jgi:hypothetical protein